MSGSSHHQAVDPSLPQGSSHDQQATFQPPTDAAPQATTPAPRKRKKAGENNVDVGSSEPRRLRRSHEACARCRSKKIKCDSKHPRCTSCTTAGTDCHQEDRHRQQLLTRGHTERLERQVILCDALLRSHIPGFDMANLEEIAKQQGVDVAPDANAGEFQPFAVPAAQRGFPLRPEGQQAQPPFPAPPYGNYMIPYPAQYQHPPQMAGVPGYFQPYVPPPGQFPLAPVQNAQAEDPVDTKGVDPQSNDLSSITSLAKVFGVSSSFTNGLSDEGPDKEDLTVGSTALESKRDHYVFNGAPRDPKKWIQARMYRNASSSGSGRISPGPSSVHPGATFVTVWLPTDKHQVMLAVKAYFTRLNFHRPVLQRAEFEDIIHRLYDQNMRVADDPGFVCSLYLVLALATLSDACHRLGRDQPPSPNSIIMPVKWPQAEEFFDLALMVKPDLRVTISSLQALILLQWYLYTERQGRTLWRLVGNLVRLSIELGLHHDPTVQEETFVPEEAQLRIRLWSIVMIHDRGTSILLGRPLAIAPSDSSTPHPQHIIGGSRMFSEHFQWSQPVADIQAKIIEALYTPGTLSGVETMRAATRIIREMEDLKTKKLPGNYKWYFTGTADWPMEKRRKLVEDITEDQGLTLLKIGISRILLLRALFVSKQLDYNQRHDALVDAVTTSHNIIIVHSQLINSPDIGFFTSPIPLHIAAMVILFGCMSNIDHLSPEMARQDVWMALDMLPRFRWRWERKDCHGGHPLIAKLAESVLKMSLNEEPTSRDLVLLPESDWTRYYSPSPLAPQDIPTAVPPPPPAPAQYTNVGGGHVYGAGNGGAGKFVADVPMGAFYPDATSNWMHGAHPPQFEGENQQELLAAIGRNATYGAPQQQDRYMLEEEKDPSASAHDVHNWMAQANRYPQN